MGAVGPPAEAAGILVERFGELADRLALVTTLDSASTGSVDTSRAWATLLQHLRDAADAKSAAPEASVRPPG